MSKFPCIHEGWTARREVSTSGGTGSFDWRRAGMPTMPESREKEIDHVTLLAVSNLGTPALVTSDRIKVKFNY
jgi:hypothetical protein